MPEETGSNESSASNSEAEDQRLLLRNSTLVGITATAYIATVIIYLIVARMFDEDEIKLHILDTLIKLLQAIARLFGSWALECERAYNEYVNALH